MPHAGAGNGIDGEDEDWGSLSATQLGRELEIPTLLYRLYGVHPDEAGDDIPLYFGISHNHGTRMRAHARLRHWWPDVRRIDITVLGTRDEAQRQETLAIATEQPRYNKAKAAYNQPPPLLLAGPPEPVAAWLTRPGAEPYAPLDGLSSRERFQTTRSAWEES